MFEWKDSYSVGIKDIDIQHKKLFQIGSDLVSAMKSDKFDKYDDIVYILNELKEYTIYHFDFEEKLLEENGVELTNTHKQQHTFFVDKLMETSTIDIDSQQESVLNDIFSFVADWITGHILNTDKQYQAPLNAKGIC